MNNGSKEKEIMEFLHRHVFDPILNSPDSSKSVKSGVHLTIGRMNRLSAEKMVHYFWSALATDNAIQFSKRLKDEEQPRFEDVFEEFRDRFNEQWLKS